MNRSAWIAASVDELNRVKSWTGRTHIHKHLFITQILGLAQVPFKFELYHFGPYSFEADHVIAEMEAFGQLGKRYEKVGYGPRYRTSELADSKVPAAAGEALGRVAEKIRLLNSSDLELIATCLWVERREEESATDTIIDRVKEIKPKYSTTRIEESLTKARGLADDLE